VASDVLAEGQGVNVVVATPNDANIIG